LNPERRPARVAVIGGGCAGLAAAFELTRPELAGRYQVTVYQAGWRLGGKGASGRGVADRVEEHGLHLWLGFYENAFRLMRECYAERRQHFPHCRFADWREAFQPAPDVCVADRKPGGWDFWQARIPPSPGEPGDAAARDPYTVLGYLRQAVMLVLELLRSSAAMQGAAVEPGPRNPGAGTDSLASAVSTLLRYGQLATTAALIEAGEILRETMDLFLPRWFGGEASLPVQLLEALTAAARRQLDILAAGDEELRRVWQVIDLILAVLRGALRSNLALDPRGFDAINDYDWRDWLRMNGASEQSLDSGFMRGIYDLVFAFEDGDIGRPRLAAGVALRGALRMFFTYRGAFFWRMNAGMGDVVFAPLYQVLKRRGVRFEFFHRLRNVGLAPQADGSYVQALEFDLQARVKNGEYQPLVEIHKMPIWPSLPDYAQLEDGAGIARQVPAFEGAWEERQCGRKMLEVENDFDFAVLAVSIGALPQVARELIDREPRWRDMVARVKTMPTRAFQLWLREHAGELGWKRPPVTLSGFQATFDTWADMSHLLPEESWRTPVKGIAYFCSVLRDGQSKAAASQAYQEQQRHAVRAQAVHFLENEVQALWPRAVASDGFRWDLLAADATAEGAGPARFDSQFWTANVNPSDRYVQSLPGSPAYRISPLDMTFDNLTIAGDWTATGLDSGCIESAVISGRLAAHAISGKPGLSEIIGYDHP
jgi:uncharacterized protein with NAD-binding domain and iron-sulfur cluster